MEIRIGDTALAVSGCYAYQHPSGKREMRITVPQSEIGYGSLKELLKSCDGEIAMTNDSGSVQIFSGYKTTYTITDRTEEDGTEVFYVTIDCVGEAERRALEAVAKAKAAEAQAEALRQKVERQEEQITEQEERIAEMTENEADLLYEMSLMQLGMNAQEGGE